MIFTDNYGEAGAINELGRGSGLPTAVSSQNSEWWWGPGNPRATTVVAVAPGPIDTTGYGAYLGQFFTRVRVAATLSNAYGLRNQEWGGHVYICTGPRDAMGPDMATAARVQLTTGRRWCSSALEVQLSCRAGSSVLPLPGA